MTAEHPGILVNGEYTDCITVMDRGLQFGDGVFETIRVHRGRPVWWQQHMDRLVRGCTGLGFRELPDPDTLLAEATMLLSACTSAVLKIIITRGCSNSGYAAPADISPNRIVSLTTGLRHPAKAEQGINLGICRQTLADHDSLAGIKHLNRLQQVLARSQCLDEGWDEGIMLDTQGNVIEGSMSNLFVWQNDQLLTPLLTNAGIKGLCREAVLSLAEENGFNVEQKMIDLDDLKHSDGIFVTNSLIGIWPVARYDQHQFTIGARTRLLQNKLENLICSAG